MILSHLSLSAHPIHPERAWRDYSILARTVFSIFALSGPVLYSLTMSGNVPAERIEQLERLHRRIEGWAGRLRAAGLDGLVGALLGAAAPLAPLGAQVLWVAQPALSLVMPRAEIDTLARALEDPTELAWLRERMEGPGDDGHLQPG